MPSQDKVMTYMAPFVRTGYNRAIVDIEEWMFEKYNDSDSIPYKDLADFLIKEMNEKKIYSSDQVLQEIVKQHKEQVIDKKSGF
jgi:hypothetical protein